MNANKTYCYLCHARQFKTFYNVGENCYLQCLHCGLIALRDMPTISDIQVRYRDQYYSKKFSGRKESISEFSYRLAVLDRFMRPPGSLLEIGASSGEFLALMREAGWRVFGVELSLRAVQVARDNYDISIFQGVLSEAGFSNNQFDVVVLYHVLEHVLDPIKLLEDVMRVVKPNGHVIIEVPHPSGFDARVSKEFLSSIIDYPNHVFLFPPNTLKRLLKTAGFYVVYMRPSFSYYIAHLLRRIVISKKVSASTVMTEDDLSLSLSHKKVSTTKLFRARNVLLSSLAFLFPGMKLTLVAKKKHFVQ